MPAVRMDGHGRFVVPAQLRRELDLCPDDVLVRRDQLAVAPAAPSVEQPHRGWRRFVGAVARRVCR